MADFKSTDTTTVDRDGDGEPITERVRRYVVRSNLRLHYSVADIYDLAQALEAAKAPPSTLLRIEYDGTQYKRLIAEWHEYPTEDGAS